MTTTDTQKVQERWEKKKLGEIVKIINGGTPSTKENMFWNGNIPWITPKDLSGFNSKYIEKGERYISQQGLENSSAQLLPINTVLFSSRAPIGYVAISRGELTTNQGFKNIICDEKQSHFNYLYYWLKWNSNHIENLSSGSTFSEASTGLMNTLDIEIPPINEQQSITAILSSLDDKIELLREQNKTLESIAQTLFKRWFVDFEYPNDVGKPYKSAGGKMIESELGMIPEEWRVGIYNNLAIVLTGKGIDIIKTKLDGHNPILGANGKIGSTDDYLFDENLIITGRVGTLGNVFISRGKVWISDNVLISKPTNFFYFTFLNLKRLNLKSLNVGSTQPLITQSALKNIPIIIPKDIIVNYFENIVTNFYQKFYLNSEQIQILTKLRDSLLPMLMKGEIRIK